VARPLVSLIAAVAENGVIGNRQELPWRLSTDQRRFRELTMGKPVVMGRKTYDAIGKPLAGRLNIVVSRRAVVPREGLVWASSLEAALRLAADRAGSGGEVMVIGGGEIYAAAMPRSDRLYITHVAAAPDGDTQFPTIDTAVWREQSQQRVPAGPNDSAATTFVIYERRGAVAPREPAPRAGSAAAETGVR
jgi:dihydrofolate reductase